MKKFRKLLPALSMLLISALLMGSSTFAWFSMNNSVTVTGMSVTTKVQDNLLIASSSFTQTAHEADSSFSNTLNQFVTGILQPVSSVDGKTFYYTSTDNVKADGSVINSKYSAYNTDGAAPTEDQRKAFDKNSGIAESVENYGKTYVGYVDYVFQVKAINTSASKIKLTKLDLMYGGTNDGNKAYRIAVFAETGETFTNGLPTSSAVGILTPAKAGNQQDGQAVSSENSLSSVTYVSVDDAVNVALNESGTHYVKFIVRLWLEGEDKTCTNATFLSLTDKWSLDLELKLVPNSDDETKSVKEITMKTTATKTEINKTATVDSTVITVSNNAYKKVTNATFDNKEVYVLSSVSKIEEGTRFFVIESNKFVTEITNQVSVKETA